MPVTHNIPYEKVGNSEPVPVEVPFDIPESWEWCRFDNATLYSTDYVANGSFASLRDNVKTYKTPNYALMVKTADFANNFTSNLTYTDEAGYKYLSKSELCGGELMLSNIGASIGKAFIIPKLNIPMTLAPNSIVVMCYDNTTLFMYYLIMSFYGQNLLKEFTAGTAMPKFSKTQLRNALIPVPPIAEQHRIVSKIEELLPYIEKYAQAEKQLNELNSAFPAQLKKSILQLAVQGKLVPQDENDEPASVLLERIREEKKALIKAGKLKKDKNESFIFVRDNVHYENVGGVERCIEDEIPFEIPESWEWVRLGEISTYANTKRKINASESDKSVWGLDLEDIEKGGRLICKKTVGERSAIGEKTLFNKGDILYSKLRPYLLKILIADEDGICTPEIVPFSLYGGIASKFIVYVLKSPYADCLINSATYGIKMPRAGTETMTGLLMPLPPISEQHRIVEKIEQLLPYTTLI